MRRGAVAGITLVAAVVLRADAAPQVPPILSERVAGVLAAAPYLLPPSPDGGKFALVQFRVTATGATPIGKAVPVDGAASHFDRTLNRGNSSRPSYWIFVRDRTTGEVRYWLPVPDPRRRRVEAEGRDQISGQAVGPSIGVISARVPLVPGAEAALFATDGAGHVSHAVASLELAPHAAPTPDTSPDTNVFASGPNGPCDPVFCPQVYSIGAVSTHHLPFNIVFLPDGFNDEAGLKLYRCAAKLLANELLSHEPWKSFACRVNFFRLDLLAGHAPIALADGCTADSCTVASVPAGDWMNACLGADGIDPTLGTPTCDPGRHPTRTLSFDTQQCRDNICREVWPSEPDGVALAQSYANCAPSPQAIVILANSNTKGGGGSVTAVQGQPGIAVITLDAMDSINRWARVAHELGHVLGLLDEYNDGGGPQEYVCGRNVYSPALSGALGCTEDLSSMWTCSTPSPDPNPPGCPVPAGCTVICDEMSCCDCESVPVPAIGLYEGAFYRKCGAYRSEERCLMRDYSSPMCGRCKSLFSDQMGGPKACLARGSEVIMLFDEKWRIQDCPMKPIPPPPPPPPDRPESTATAPANRAVLLWPAERVTAADPRAVVEKNGVVGEVGVRKITGKIRDLDRADTIHTLEIRSVGATGSKHLEWRRDGELIRLDTLEGNLIAKGLELGALVGPVIVVDDVRGATWTTKQVFWETTVEGVKPSSPSPR
jgi:hypothetical protein